MKSYQHLGTLLALSVVAAPGAALAAPNASDQVMIWQTFNVTTPANPAAVSNPNKTDTTVFFTKQYWLTPQIGLFALYNTAQSLSLRGMYKLALGDTGIGATFMGGLRSSGLGTNLAAPSVGFRQGPEVAMALAKPLGAGFSVSAMGSYARLFEMNPGGPTPVPTNTGEPTNLMFYALNLNQQVAPTTTLSYGVLGGIFAGAGGTTRFHDIGPTLTFSQTF